MSQTSEWMNGREQGVAMNAADIARFAAEADQHNAAVIAHTTWACDAFNLCDDCRRNRDNAIARQHIARVERVREMMGR